VDAAQAAGASVFAAFGVLGAAEDDDSEDEDVDVEDDDEAAVSAGFGELSDDPFDESFVRLSVR
jgi:hypothetical protein